MRTLAGLRLPEEPAQRWASPAEVGSFYHLGGERLADHQPCQGTACFVARHLQKTPPSAPLNPGQRIYCLGQCFRAPVQTGASVKPYVHVAARESVVLERVAKAGARHFRSYLANGGCRALEGALSRPLEEVLTALEVSGLRGRGGAGFPTARKWRSVSQQPDPEKYVIANADEGDAGAYLDRYLLEDDPFALIEGMVLAGYATGAHKGWIYLRQEYPEAEKVLRDALQEARSARLIGPRVLGHDFAFEIELFIGHGSYVCGEETALIRSIEGQRPEVMVRPPYPTEHGLFGKPTLIDNVETLVNVPWIVQRGGVAYHDLGFSSSRGTKVVSLNSLFARPGLYEVEFGITIREIVEELGGGLRNGSLRGVIIGGPLAGIIPPHLLDTRFGFEELHAIGAGVGHGGVIAFDEHTSIPELVRHVFSFGAYESCGKCVPCRLGSRRVENIFKSIGENGSADKAAEREWADIVSALKLTSLCGLGTGLGEFAASVLKYYGKELEQCFK